MPALKSKLRELIFECDSEEEAMDLLKNYRKKNFHLVSKKVADSKDSTVALKLIKFRQPSKAEDLETVWENFVSQMAENHVEDSFVSEILTQIRTKDKFWELHPDDHLRDIVMDARNFVKPEDLAKVLVFVAPEEELKGFFCSYQKSIASMVKSMSVFVMCPERMKSDVKDLRVSAHVQTIPYSAKSQLTEYQKDIEAKIGIVLVTPEDLALFTKSSLEDYIHDQKISLLVSPSVKPTEALNISAPQYVAAGYSSDSSAKNIFSALNKAIKNHQQVAFLWDEDTVGSILNPEAQVLKTLDDLLENQPLQHFINK